MHSRLQVRQHVAHKRTFFFLEQLILKHGADESCVNVKEMHEVGARGWWWLPKWSRLVAAGGCSARRQPGRLASHAGQPPCCPAAASQPRPNPSLPQQGVDFYFANRAHAVKFIDFLQTVAPIRYRRVLCCAACRRAAACDAPCLPLALRPALGGAPAASLDHHLGSLAQPADLPPTATPPRTLHHPQARQAAGVARRAHF